MLISDLNFTWVSGVRTVEWARIRITTSVLVSWVKDSGLEDAAGRKIQFNSILKFECFWLQKWKFMVLIQLSCASTQNKSMVVFTEWFSHIYKIYDSIHVSTIYNNTNTQYHMR